MNRLLILILILILIASSVAVVFLKLGPRPIEGFSQFYFSSRSVCPTRNMSYDIRGDVPIKRSALPLHNSSLGPEYPDKCRRFRV